MFVERKDIGNSHYQDQFLEEETIPDEGSHFRVIPTEKAIKHLSQKKLSTSHRIFTQYSRENAFSSYSFLARPLDTHSNKKRTPPCSSHNEGLSDLEESVIIREEDSSSPNSSRIVQIQGESNLQYRPSARTSERNDGHAFLNQSLFSPQLVLRKARSHDVSLLRDMSEVTPHQLRMRDHENEHNAGFIVQQIEEVSIEGSIDGSMNLPLNNLLLQLLSDEIEGKGDATTLAEDKIDRNSDTSY